MLLKFILPTAVGFTVVADRYVLDFLVWVSLTTEDLDYLNSFEARFFIALVSKVRFKVYVTASFEKLLSRKKDGMSSEFLMNQLKLYEKIASAVNAYTLNTSFKSLDESLIEVLNLLESHRKILITEIRRN